MKKYSGLLALFGFLLLLFFLTRRPVVINGTELGYRLPPGTSPGVEDVVRARVDALALEGEVERKEDLLLVRIPDATAEEIADVKRLLYRKGKLELRKSADGAAREKFKADGVVPEGFDAVEFKDPEYGPALLIRKGCVLEGGRIIAARPEKELLPGGEHWYVTFELDAKASAGFDAAAAELYARRPPGLLAILLDGKLHSAPAVQTERFGGRARITGLGGERETKDLAIMLVTGALALPLDGPPEFERPFRKTR